MPFTIAINLCFKLCYFLKYHTCVATVAYSLRFGSLMNSYCSQEEAKLPATGCHFDGSHLSALGLLTISVPCLECFWPLDESSSVLYFCSSGLYPFQEKITGSLQSLRDVWLGSFHQLIANFICLPFCTGWGSVKWVLVETVASC